MKLQTSTCFIFEMSQIVTKIRLLGQRLPFIHNYRLISTTVVRSMAGGEAGSGAGKGGGSGGSIRDAGGSFGKQEAAREEEYFRRQQKQLLTGLKDHLSEEVEQHEAQIKQHEQAIKKAKEKIAELQKEGN